MKKLVIVLLGISIGLCGYIGTKLVQEKLVARDNAVAQLVRNDLILFVIQKVQTTGEVVFSTQDVQMTLIEKVAVTPTAEEGI